MTLRCDLRNLPLGIQERETRLRAPACHPDLLSWRQFYLESIEHREDQRTGAVLQSAHPSVVAITARDLGGDTKEHSWSPCYYIGTLPEFKRSANHRLLQIGCESLGPHMFSCDRHFSSRAATEDTTFSR